MKQLFALFCSTLMISSFFLHAQESHSYNHINWLTNYDEAVSLSKSNSKPIVLFFTGSDWCGWCSKLEKEALDTPEFAQIAGTRFVFVKLDFPLNTTLPPHLAVQNKDLQKKYNVKGFPALIILDHQQNQIGSTGYRPGGGKMYAEHLSKFISDSSSYQQKMKQIDKQKLSTAELKKMYETAQSFGYTEDSKKILEVGISSSDQTFFLVEKYRLMMKTGLDNEGALKLRKQITDIDPNNKKMTQYQLAVIDFESTNELLEKGKRNADIAVAPLVHYIEKFGTEDKENLWRLEMIISQVYFDKNNLREALNYAKNSYNSAPACAKAEISLAVKNIQAQLSTYETALAK